MNHQDEIRRAQLRRDEADRAYHDSIRAASRDGASIRELAAFTKMSHTTVQKILRGE